MFDRGSGPTVGGGPQEREAVGAEQPLVGGGDEEIGFEPGDGERHRPERLGGIHHDRRPRLAGGLTHLHQVDHRPVRPVDVGDGDHGGARSDRLHHPLRPGPVVTARNGDDPAAGSLRRFPPRIDVGGKLVGEHDDLVSRRQLQVGDGDGDAVADGGDDGDTVGVVGTPQERGEETPETFRGDEEVLDIQLPGVL